MARPKPRHPQRWKGVQNIDVLICRALPEPFAYCPRCLVSPFRSFMRGQVQRRKYGWRTLWLPIGEPRPHCAVICSSCKEIVSYE